jgi:peptidylprolyl isomerase
MKRTLLAALVLATAVTGCSDDSPKTTDTVKGSSCTPTGTGTTDLKTKPVYTVTKDTPPTATTNVDIVCGDGAEAKAGSAVAVKYVGVNYADGKEFDSSWKRGTEETLPFTIGSGVIEGFSKGTTGMKVGGRRQVTIPPADGYGDSGPVPGGTLVFLIDLVSVD